VMDGNRWLGRVVRATMPPAVEQMLREYDEMVNNQVFSLVDALSERIDALDLQAYRGAERISRPVTDLFVSVDGGISFMVA